MADPLADAVAMLLRHAPQAWADVPSDACAEALLAITAAGFVERRITFTIRLPGVVEAQRITIEVTGEYGVVEAMEAVVQDWWVRHGERWKDLYRELGEPVRPIVIPERDQWRLTPDGQEAKADLEQGETVPLDFALKRGFFNGQPRLLPDGRITQRQPVRGYGRLVAIENAPSTPLSVNIGNWDAGAQAFGKVFEALAKKDLRAFQTPTGQPVCPHEDKVAPKRKRSSMRGDGQEKLVAALIKHHQYDNGNCLNLEPISCRALARMAGVSKSTASEFFAKEFRGYRAYRRVCTDPRTLAASLRLLNGDVSPYHLYGRTPPGEREADDE